MKNQKLLMMLWAFIISGQSSAQNWIPDSLFGNNSRMSVSAGGSENFSNFLLQPDGKIVACGYDEGSGFYNNTMIRFDVCGRIDSSFGSNGIVNHRFDNRNLGYHFSLQSDGKFLAVGIQSSSNAGSTQIPFVARYHNDGSVDTNFANSGTHTLRFDPVSSGAFYSARQMSDGRILCGGRCSANANGGVHGLGVMRFMSDGSLDSSFSGDGKAVYVINTLGMPARARILQNGKIIVAGRYNGNTGQTFFAATCFDSTGVTDPSFGNAGEFTDTVSLQFVYNDAYLDIQADENLVMASNRDPASLGIEVIRITPAGLLESSFGTNGHVTITIPGMTCTGIKVMSNGRIWVMGQMNAMACAVQLLSNGNIDTTFAVNGLLSGIDLLPNGSDQLIDALELPYSRILMGNAWPDHNFRRFSLQSNVPHISGNAFQLQTTGTGAYQWYLNGTAISGADSSTHVPLSDGNYTVQITDEFGCEYISTPFPVAGVGLDESGIDQTIKVFPVPAVSSVNVQCSELISGIRITDLTGQVILNLEKLRADNVLLPVSEIAAGVYFLHITVSKGEVVRKLVIE